MVKEGASQGRFGGTRVSVVPPLFVKRQLGIDNSGISFSRKQINNISYSEWDMTLGQYCNVNYIIKPFQLMPSGTQPVLPH